MTAVVIPSLGGRHLAHCLAAVRNLDPAPRRTVVVISGGGSSAVKPPAVEFLTVDARLGYATAVNRGIDHLGDDETRVAVLNDDAFPAPGWLAALATALDADPALAAVQGTVTDEIGAVVDGRGITLDELGLPVQVDRGASPQPEPPRPQHRIAVSGTASLYRVRALHDAALADGAIFDPRFGSYHEDLDLGLRMMRLGWQAAWVPGALARHVGSATGRRLGWRHPWWVLTNRWRALAGNLSSAAVFAAFPVLLRGELRAVRALFRDNPRALPTATAALICLPWLVVRAMRRPSPGRRLTALPEAMS
jgi:GT2 family glycosyltransferase